jgi:hypothetical protein
MLDERRVGGITGRELDDPLFAADFDQPLRPRAAEAHAGREHPPLCLRNGLVGEHLAHDFLELIRIGEARQRAELAGRIRVGAARDAERAKAVVAGEVQELEQRQPRRLVDEADDLLAPAIRSRVIDRAHCGAFVRR